LGKDAQVKLTDLGLSAKYDVKSGNKLTAIVGTPFYVAPEVLEGSYDHRCDIWSIGILFYFMLSGITPFFSSQENQVYQMILKDEPKFTGSAWKRISNGAKDLCKKLLQKDPSNRIS